MDESHISSSHSNKLLVYNGGIPRTRMNNPNAKKFGDVVEHTLQNLSHIHHGFYE